MEPYRKFVLSTFRRFGIGTSAFEEPIAKECAILTQELATLQEKPVDLTWYLNNAVSNLICRVVFGKRFDFTDEKIHRLTDLLNRQNELSGAGGLDMFTPIHIVTETRRQPDKLGDELIEFIDDMIEELRENFDPDNLKDMIDIWLNDISGSQLLYESEEYARSYSHDVLGWNGYYIQHHSLGDSVSGKIP